jgi:hypothetical protein
MADIRITISWVIFSSGDKVLKTLSTQVSAVAEGPVIDCVWAARLPKTSKKTIKGFLISARFLHAGPPYNY